ncbi:unnamed protein product [Porites lobata]|uniref:THAP-type domain-containing protein n=1 Tax=Porites lobata TaxID=104759 RepID=A0ABN8Q6V1_9CNID|nr:unnamed protein product [Porites lobata]
MVSCVVPDCHNYSEKTGEAVSYHKFPQDDRRKAWLDRVRRVDMPPLENSHVCSEHFLPSCFEIDFRAQLMGEKARKHLRDDAIPSLFKYGPEPKKARLSSESRLQKQNHKQVTADFPDCDDESSSSSEDVLEDSSDQDQIENNEETGSSEPRVHDIGIQCCCQPLTLRSVAVQTEDSKQKKGKANVTPTPIQNAHHM